MTSKVLWLPVLGVAGWLWMAGSVAAQTRPYIGFVYPAGGQQGTTFRVKLGGQGMSDLERVIVTGQGVTAKVVEYNPKLGPQEITLLNEQLRELRKGKSASMLAMASKMSSDTMMSSDSMMSSEMMMSSSSGDMMTSASTGGKGGKKGAANETVDESTLRLMGRIEKRVREYVQRPACSSIASLATVEVTVDRDAPPGEREIRVASARGVSNPLVFHVGQLPEYCRKPMVTAAFQVLGKEELALRKRPAEEIEDRITIPCVVNGQIASGEMNRYRFEARKGQRLVISALARQLIPYIADAVPGWFQPVLTVYDANGKELAYNDDYRFKPDPTLLFEVPKDGEYVFAITDAIYRGREDFVYRVTIGELPFVTSIFPLGCRAGETPKIEMKGWNLQKAQLAPPAKDAKPGVCSLVARQAGVVSNAVPFAIDTLPECLDKESNNDAARAQKVSLPIIVNGRIDREDDWDVFQFTGKANQTIVAEVYARRLDSPLDSMLRVTDASGKVLAVNDDYEQAGSGVNTHDADSYLMVKLPADGTYYVYLSDAARSGGEEYGYRLRISAPRPSFDLRVVPSSLSIRGKSNSGVSVYVIRHDGFAGQIKLGLKDPPAGFSASSVTLSGTQAVTRLTIKTDLMATKEPVALTIQGVAKIGDREVARAAVPAEDRMQAFLWRHLVPVQDLRVLVYDPSYQPAPKRVPVPTPLVEKKTEPLKPGQEPPKAKFTKQQVASRLRQIELLFQEGLLTDAFRNEKVAECEVAQ